MTSTELIMVIGATTTAIVTVIGAVRTLRSKIEEVHKLVNSNFTESKKATEESNQRLIQALEEVRRLTNQIADLTGRTSDKDIARSAGQDLKLEEGKVGVIEDEKDF